MDAHIMMARCGHCPLADGPDCKGQTFARFCELVDPAHKDYHPEYIASLASELFDRAGTDKIITDALSRPIAAVPRGNPCGKC
jgi:hypothetical protein